MKTLLDALSRFALFISASCIVAMTGIITYQVIARYVFNDSPAWSERLSLVLLAYLVFFGAAVGVHKKFHIRIEVLRNAVPERLGQIFEISAHAAVAIAGLVMLIAGFQLTTSLWEFAIPSLGHSSRSGASAVTCCRRAHHSFRERAFNFSDDSLFGKSWVRWN